MKISLITPANKGTHTGNRTTAVRWARVLRSLNHRVDVATRYDGSPADLLIALHAWCSADSVRAWRARNPQRPLIVGLGGTNIYRFQHSDPEVTLGSMAIAGSVGLLGRAYPGYFPVRDTAALTALLHRAESEGECLAELRRRCAARAPLFDPARERQAWHEALEQVTGAGRSVPVGRSAA